MEIFTRKKNERLIITTPNDEEITIIITETTDHYVNFSVEIPDNYDISMKSDLLNWAYES